MQTQITASQTSSRYIQPRLLQDVYYTPPTTQFVLTARHPLELLLVLRPPPPPCKHFSCAHFMTQVARRHTRRVCVVCFVYSSDLDLYVSYAPVMLFVEIRRKCICMIYIK